MLGQEEEAEPEAPSFRERGGRLLGEGGISHAEDGAGPPGVRWTPEDRACPRGRGPRRLESPSVERDFALGEGAGAEHNRGVGGHVISVPARRGREVRRERQR